MPKKRRLVQNTRRNYFDGFLQFAVKAQRKDENPKLSVVVETVKLLGNCFYGSENTDCNQHTVT